jgi:protein TonB
VDSKPKVLSRSKVRYPEMARKNKITGHVLLRFYLDEKGSIFRLQVIKAEPPGIFEDAALASVKQWQFAPAMKDGRPVPFWVELPMPFILK